MRFEVNMSASDFVEQLSNDDDVTELVEAIIEQSRVEILELIEEQQIVEHLENAGYKVKSPE